MHVNVHFNNLEFRKDTLYVDELVVQQHEITSVAVNTLAK